jgi:exopolysaccharide biosynthesis polyprenyl glycosylphosphotransferase
MPYSVEATTASRADQSPLSQARQTLRQQVADHVSARPKAISRWTASAVAMLADAIAVMLASVVVGTLGGVLHDVSIVQEIIGLSLIGVTLVGLMRLFGAYKFTALASPVRRLAALSGAMAFIAAGALVTGHFADIDPAIAKLIGPWAATATAGLIGTSALIVYAIEALRARGRFAPTVVIVGATNIAERLIEEARAAEHAPFEIVGIFDDRLSRVPTSVANLPVLGTTEDLLKFSAIDSLDWIIVAMPWSAEDRIAGMLERLRTVSTRILLAPDMVGLRLADAVGGVQDGPALVEVLGRPMDGGRRVIKEIEDKLLGTLMTIALAPVMLAIAALVRLDSPGPALFKQRRVGYSGRLFDVYKFRTLRTDMADAVAAKQVTEDDPRVTRLGHILRKYSLDELPQLLNVVRGEMSLIGPRPFATGMVVGNTHAQDILIEYARRRQMKPGMTGWSQVNGGHGSILSEADLRRRLEHDLEYINNWSLWFDIAILFKTVGVVLGGRGKKATPTLAKPVLPSAPKTIARPTTSSTPEQRHAA